MRVIFIKRMTRNARFHLIHEKYILIFKMSDGMDSISSELHIKKNSSFLPKRTEMESHGHHRVTLLVSKAARQTRTLFLSFLTFFLWTLILLTTLIFHLLNRILLFPPTLFPFSPVMTLYRNRGGMSGG